MDLTNAQRNRAAGVLLGQASGDALGVPYEFGPRIKPGQASMIGGGLGPYAPGEWSDDTQMAICIAEVAATGADLASTKTLNQIAPNFLDWQSNGASDIGIGTSTVLSSARQDQGPLAARMTRVSKAYARAGRGAGNGALMRTGIVGLTALEDPKATAKAAARIAALTHADDRCLDSAVLWSEAVRLAVTEGRLDPHAGIALLPAERRDWWEARLLEAETHDPASFTPNGYTVTALQAAWAAIFSTRTTDGPDHVEAALQTAIAIGHDTDTVAAIAGALVGAYYGASGLATDLARRVHGWPGMRGRDLIGLALDTATGGQKGPWPGPVSMIDGRGLPLAVPHPDDPDVLLGTEADLTRCAELGVTAVVSLSRVGDPEIAAAGVEPGNHAEVWLVDTNDPTVNAHLAWTLLDAARTVKQMRDEGDRVLLHCVAAENRTPAIALAYSGLLGADPETAASLIEKAVGHPCEGEMWHTAGQLVAQKADG